MSPTSGATGRRWPLRVGAGLALVAVIAVIVAVVLVTGSSPTPSAASPTGSGSVSVQRRNLVLTDTESGTIGYSNPQTVYDRLSGTITWLPQVGQRIGRGQALFRVDGQPVPLLYGATPAFRSLSADDSAGPDIEQLNRNLIALGFNPGGIVDDDIWQLATTLGVEQFQASLGETETGVLELGQVVFLPGVQLVASLDGSVGATGGGGGSSASAGSAGGASSGASTPLAPAGPEFVGLVLGLGKHGDTPGPTTAPGKPPAPASPGHPAPSTSQSPGSAHHARARERQRSASAAERELAALTALLKAETAQLRAQSAALRAAKAAAHSAAHASTGKSTTTSGGGSSAAGGGASDGGSATGGASPTAVLETTSPRLVVTVDLPASAQGEAQVGDRVTVELPAGSTVGGTVTAVSRIAVSSSGSGSGGGSGGGGGSGSGSGPGSGSSGATSSVPVTISLHGHLRAAGLDQAAVSVNFTQQRADNVLSVPVTALLAVPGGSYVLQEASAPHTMIPVQTGLFAAGYVQVSGPGLYSGLSVTASQG
jgi:hypothetical protein